MVLSEVPFGVPTLWFCFVVLNRSISQRGQVLGSILYILSIISGIDVSACICENLLFIHENSHCRELLWGAKQASSSNKQFLFVSFVRISALYLNFKHSIYMWSFSPRVWSISRQFLLLRAWTLCRRFLLGPPGFLILFHWILRVQFLHTEISGSKGNPRNTGINSHCLLIGNFTSSKIFVLALVNKT